MKTVLVTGGAGFIGSHLVEALVERGERVRVLDNFSTGRRKNLAAVLSDIELLEGDLRDLATVRQAVDGVEVVFHHAAIPSVPASITNPAECEAVNVGGTLNLVMAGRDAGVRRVVYASSCAIYGDPDRLPVGEDFPPQPLSPYAVSKLTGEMYLALCQALYGIETVSLRYFNVFGPRQNPRSLYAAVVPIFIAAMSAGQSPTVYGDGEQTRDFIYVGDVVRANLLAAEAPGAAGAIVNIASGERHTVNELVQRLNALLGTQIEPAHAAPRPGDIVHSWAAVDRARSSLGFSAAVSFQEGLKHTVESFLAS